MNIKYHFFGKDCVIDRSLANRLDLNRALSEKKIPTEVLFLNQIHGSEVMVIDTPEKIYGKQNLPRADALVSNLKNIVIGVITADCAPVLFYDEEKNIIAAAHAGWRGAKFGVIASTVAEMKKLQAKNIKAIIGPMIQQRSYQVSEEFFDDFLSEDVTNKVFFRNSISADKYQFDLSAYVEKKVRLAGVEKIENLKIDTYENEKNFFSFRRSTHLGENDCGRNVSIIAITN